MIEELRPLKEALLAEYGSFVDKRVKTIDRGDRFIVDDQTRNDFGADKQLYGCSVRCSLPFEVPPNSKC